MNSIQFLSSQVGKVIGKPEEVLDEFTPAEPGHPVDVDRSDQEPAEQDELDTASALEEKQDEHTPVLSQSPPESPETPYNQLTIDHSRDQDSEPELTDSKERSDTQSLLDAVLYVPRIIVSLSTFLFYRVLSTKAEPSSPLIPQSPSSHHSRHFDWLIIPVLSLIFPPTPPQTVPASYSDTLSFEPLESQISAPRARLGSRPSSSKRLVRDKLLSYGKAVPGSAIDDSNRSIKSTSSSFSGATPHYPRVPFPTRLLLARNLPRKTLVLDLDETLIHTLSRSSTFSSAHMVEVKLDKMATMYYVQKRPYCDQFLEAVSHWYSLVVFTASVQQYADPMIDWLERERQYFQKRLYRNSCIPSPEGHIKDLSIVESDLSRVIIVDNSPISYRMQQCNAIEIEGWISDPSDRHLQHLIPFLEALSYATDVRTLLSLKLGELAFE